jgi:hypothetical protein
MVRFVVALLVAPLCVPLVVAAYGLILTFQHRDHPEIQYLAVFPLILVAVISYGGTLLLGVPLLLLLRLLGLSGLWVAGVVGVFVGAVFWFVAVGLYLIGHGAIDISHLTNLAGIANLIHLIVGAGLSNVLWPCGALGAAVGVAFWLIARPDRGGNHGRGSANNVTRAQTDA